MWISSFIQRNGSDEARWSVNICGESSGVGDMWSAEERERTEVNCLWQNLKFVLYVGRSNIKRSLSVATTEWAWLGNDLVQWCCGEWGHSPHLQTLPSLQLVEFKISEREVPITIAQCIVIKFLTNENVGPSAIWRRLREQYGESTLLKTQVIFWHKEFRGGRDAVQNTSHKWHPRTSITPENITAVRDLIEGNRWLTVVKICQELGTCISSESVQYVIKNVLLFQKILAQWVPRLLSDQQKNCSCSNFWNTIGVLWRGRRRIHSSHSDLRWNLGASLHTRDEEGQ